MPSSWKPLQTLVQFQFAQDQGYLPTQTDCFHTELTAGMRSLDLQMKEFSNSENQNHISITSPLWVPLESGYSLAKMQFHDRPTAYSANQLQPICSLLLQKPQ
eukprot:Gb_06551 [translate_table: standard]